MMGETQRLAVEAVLCERLRQDHMWGQQDHDPITWTAILAEEFGEFAAAALGVRFGDGRGAGSGLRTEAVHVAAVALAIIECLDRREDERAGDLPVAPTGDAGSAG